MPYYNYIHFRPVLAAGRGAGLVLAVAVALVAAGPLLVLSLVTDTAASLAASVGPSSVGPLVAVGPLVVASVRRGPSAVGRWSPVFAAARRRSVGPSASLAAYVINTSVLVAGQNHENGPPWLVGVFPYPLTRRSAAFSRNFFLFFLFFIFLSGGMEASS